MQPQVETSGNSPTGSVPRKQRRVGGMTWILIGIAVLFVLGLLISTLRTQREVAPRVTEASVRSIFGVNEFDDVKEGGVTFSEVYPPGSPADKAGLVGGDIITTFDGRTVKDQAEMANLLRQTAVGKTVEITYLRDGETKKTKLSTISQEQFDQIQDAFENRSGGKGQLGFDEGAARVVSIENTKISGVMLPSLSSSGPAVLAGIQEGDVIIEFDGAPIRRVGELVMRVWRATPYSTVKVVVMRGTERLEIPVKMGKRR